MLLGYFFFISFILKDKLGVHEPSHWWLSGFKARFTNQLDNSFKFVYPTCSLKWFFCELIQQIHFVQLKYSDTVSLICVQKLQFQQFDWQLLKCLSLIQLLKMGFTCSVGWTLSPAICSLAKWLKISLTGTSSETSLSLRKADTRSWSKPDNSSIWSRSRVRRIRWRKFWEKKIKNFFFFR